MNESSQKDKKRIKSILNNMRKTLNDWANNDEKLNLALIGRDPGKSNNPNIPKTVKFQLVQVEGEN